MCERSIRLGKSILMLRCLTFSATYCLLAAQGLGFGDAHDE